MGEYDKKAIAIVGIGAVMPDANDVHSFWNNIKQGKYSISEVSPERWDPELYYDPDPKAPNKTYSKIGAWVKDFSFNPSKLGIPIPPRVIDAMDPAQQWSIAASHQALTDYGYPERPLNPEKIAVIFGNALAGEYHYHTSLRIRTPEYLRALSTIPEFTSLPPAVQEALLNGLQSKMNDLIPNITEDTMPGELSNVIAGRVANVLNLGGPNFVTDAACASSFAAMSSAMLGLQMGHYDAALTGGIDRNMGVEGFVKFAKIGALSPDGSRPYAEGANGFVMGEGAGVFLLKRLADAERDGDRIYAVIRGIGGSSDGKGKGITAPNPIGQQRAIERAWLDAGLSPAEASYIEGHGTSTRVGDVVEVESMERVFEQFNLRGEKVALGSVKSNIGHLKSAAGAAGLLKVLGGFTTGTIPPNVNFDKPNPQINFDRNPFYVTREPRSWERPKDGLRRAGVSSFGFGGTNFHVVLEEYMPGLLTSTSKTFPAVEYKPEYKETEITASVPALPPRGLLFIGAQNVQELQEKVQQTLQNARGGIVPPSDHPAKEELQKPERLAVDYEDSEDLTKKLEKTQKVFASDNKNAWKMLTAQGIFRGSGKPGKIVFMFPGQGSQYANMLKELTELYPAVSDTYSEADEVMQPLFKGRKLTDYILCDEDKESIKQTEEALRDTTITQPAVLTADVATMRLLNTFGFKPDFLIGHSLGEYAALVYAGVLTFPEALKVVSARGREMSKVSLEDNGCMAAVSAPIEKVQRLLKTIPGYVVIANINSPSQSVIAGSTDAVEEAVSMCKAEGFEAVKIPVSHAFHTKVVAPASGPLRRVIEKMNVQPPRMPVIANVTGDQYPNTREEILDILALHLASPVQFVKSMQKLYQEGARIFVEVGPKRVLSALANDNLKEYDDVTILYTNHPRKGALPALNEAFCALYAAGVVPEMAAERLEKIVSQTEPEAPKSEPVQHSSPAIIDGRLPLTGSVVISGAGLGLPGQKRNVFDDHNIERILNGEIFIEPLPESERVKMLEKRVTRLIKRESGAEMVLIDDIDRTIKLAGQRGTFDLADEFGVSAARIEALDISTQLAIAAGIEALRDAGIPLVMRYRRTSKGTYLPDRWMLPEALRDETGIIFGSAFPGLDRMAEETDRYYSFRNTQDQLTLLKQVRAGIASSQKDLIADLESRLTMLQNQLEEMNYHFDRRFIFRILNMGHSQFAEYIGARGPNTAVNAACATTTHAVAIAEDWIRSGRCRRVIIVAGDDVTSGPLTEWVGTGLLASGATTTEGDIAKAVLPFDRRRNGMIMGMGAAALVVESEDSVQERGMRAISEVLGTQIANSAFHGTRLDVDHVSLVMENLVAQVEERFNLKREQMTDKTMFMSHETYTPARGGSAAAEIHALRNTFGVRANQVVICNTKGFTGHTMGVGVEDVVAIKALEKGMIPPIANITNGFEPDPELGDLKLSKGGKYPLEYALRLGAGFGSQIAMLLLRKIPCEGARINDDVYKGWLTKISGNPSAELEYVKRTLRIRDDGPPTRQIAGSEWKIGYGPTQWAAFKEMDQVLTSTEPQALSTAGSIKPEKVESGVQHTALSKENVKEIEAFVLDLVSEKTGYPQDMLDMELDLEADLGVDTVKQAELFSTVREKYQIPRREDLRLSDYNSLEKVVDFVKDSLAALEPVSASASDMPVVELAPAAVIDDEAIKSHLLNLVCEKTGYPIDMLDLDLDLEADLGVDTVKQAELFAELREHYQIPRREDLRLAEYHTLAKVIEYVKESLQDAAGDSQSVTEEVETQDLVHSEVKQDTIKEEEVEAILLQMVSDKTGYPVEMLELELDLEADLGVDTVKQAELFAQVREYYQIPRREDLSLSDYNTLAKVIEFVMESTCSSANEEEQQPVETKEIVEEAPEEQENSEMIEIKSVVLLMVSEKTGYPQDMLDIELDLEADLGVDTVKQAELLAMIREKYGIPRRDDLRLSDYNTLSKVINFVKDSLEENNAGQAEEEEPEVVSADPAQEILPEIEPPEIIRRIPAPVLRPKLDLCKPTGLKLDAGMRFIIVTDQGKTADSLARRLRAKKVDLLVLNPLKDTLERVQEWQQAGPVNGVYFLPGLDIEPSIEEMDEGIWHDELDRRVGLLYRLMRSIEGNPMLISATRFGGLHGYTSDGISAPLGGAVSGFTKAYAWEHRGTLVKVIDFSLEINDREIAAKLVAETLSDPGAVEIGWEGGQRFAISLLEQTVQEEARFPLENGSVFLVTGGAGGITVPIVNDLAGACQGTFYLTGRTPMPDLNDPDLENIVRNPSGLKQDLMKRMSASGEKVTPAMVEKAFAGLERAASIKQVLDAVELEGGKAHYVACDVTDGQAVDQLVKGIIEKEGRLDVVLHAAGVEKSHLLEQKSPEEFNLVFSVKTDGFFNLVKSLKNAGHMPKAMVSFSSVAGRLGNAGQTDYSAANDLLCKLSLSLSEAYPETQFVTLDWGAWAEVGMASRGSLPELMNRAGIDMIAPEQAAKYVRYELQAGTRGEVLVAGSLGIMAKGRDRQGGLDLEKANQALTEGQPIHVMLSRLTGYDLYTGIRLEVELDPKEEPFLYDHALNGIAVLPGVMGIEGFSIAARHIASVLGSSEQGFQVVGLENVQFRAALKFYKDEPRNIIWQAQVYRLENHLVAYVTLQSKDTRLNHENELVLHFQGKVLLEPNGSEEVLAPVALPTWKGENTVDREDIYRLYFHGPAFQVLEGVERDGDLLIGKLSENLLPITAHEQQMLSAPLLIELCMQTAGVQEIGANGALSLPSSIDKVEIFKMSMNGNKFFAEVLPAAVGDCGGFDARVVDEKGNLYIKLTNYCTAKLNGSVEEELIQPLRKLVAQN